MPLCPVNPHPRSFIVNTTHDTFLNIGICPQPIRRAGNRSHFVWMDPLPLSTYHDFPKQYNKSTSAETTYAFKKGILISLCLGGLTKLLRLDSPRHGELPGKDVGWLVAWRGAETNGSSTIGVFGRHDVIELIDDDDKDRS